MLNEIKLVLVLYLLSLFIDQPFNLLNYASETKRKQGKSWSLCLALLVDILRDTKLVGIHLIELTNFIVLVF
jgi:hypothetical protein